jgi:tetrapyrrole methylase family protein / MazG family protein
VDAGGAPGQALPVVVAVGLGPAGPEYLSALARETMRSLPAFVRTERHLAATEFVAAGAIPLDECYERASSFEEAYRAIVSRLVEAASATGRVAYGVPGSPEVLERTVQLLRAERSIALEVVPGMSFLDLVWSRLAIDPVEAGVRLVDGGRFAEAAAGERGPMLVAQLWSKSAMSELKLAVEEAPSAPVVLLHHLGHDDEQVLELDWSEIDRTIEVDHLSCLYIPHLEAPVASEIQRATEVVRVLRDRCPWDMAQSHESLVRHLLEETYEAIDAISALGSDPGPTEIDALEEELGDVLCQVLFHSRIAEQEGLFSLADVAGHLADKLVLRHPHVFGTDEGTGGTSAVAEEVLAAWERSKLEEKGRSSVMEGMPLALPSLALAEKVLKKAATLGLGAPELADAPGEGPVAPIDEDALATALLDLVRRALDSGLNPEAALRTRTLALRERIRRTEAEAESDGVVLHELEAAERRRRVADAGR